MSYHTAGMGATGPGGYPIQTHCLTDQFGGPVMSLYARNPDRYGNTNEPYQVCYRTRDPGPGPGPVEITNGRSRCLSIYDLYGQRLCFTPRVPTAPVVVGPDPGMEKLSEDPEPILATPDPVVSIETIPTVAEETPVVVAAPAPSPAPLPAPVPAALPPATTAMPPSDETLLVGMPEDPMPIFDEDPMMEMAPAKTGPDGKTLAIGGIVALVAIGGVAYLATRKKR